MHRDKQKSPCACSYYLKKKNLCKISIRVYNILNLRIWTVKLICIRSKCLKKFQTDRRYSYLTKTSLNKLTLSVFYESVMRSLSQGVLVIDVGKMR